MNPRDLPDLWRSKAEGLRELGAEAQARTLEWCAGELEEVLSAAKPLPESALPCPDPDGPDRS